MEMTMIKSLCKRLIELIFFSLCGIFPLSTGTAQTPVIVKDDTGAQAFSYRESYALLIGSASYEHSSWNSLTNIPSELQTLQAVLEASGFSVAVAMNLSGTNLRTQIREFLAVHGRKSDARVLLFFSGHGYSRHDVGYFVPLDADDPIMAEGNFLRSAVSMHEVLGWAREIEAKHALFVFDSCFSGTLFEAKALPDVSRSYIDSITAKPVREFLTAGDVDEEVPARSVFLPMFIRGIEGEADYTRDGYVTGTELSIFLADNVPKYSKQTPQFGKIRDPELDRGDFVFVVRGKNESGMSSRAVSILRGIATGSITFGRPILYTAKERGLTLPSSVDRQYDVYWVDFAFTLRYLDEERLKRLRFSVSMAGDAVALDLIPLRLDAVEQEWSGRSAVDIELAGGGSIPVGEYFRKSIAYAHLLPSVTGFGWGEGEFGWELSGKAISTGSHRFVAIVGVPRGQRELKLDMAASLESEGWLSSLGSNMERTGVVPITLEVGLGAGETGKAAQ